MLRCVRCDSSVSEHSPPASAIASSSVIARSTDWMLWRSERSLAGLGLAPPLAPAVLSSTCFPLIFLSGRKQIGGPEPSQVRYEMAKLALTMGNLRASTPL